MLLTSVLALTAGLVAQDGGSAEQVSAVLAELIQRSESIGPFKASYQAQGLGSEDMTFGFEYLPPERLHVVVESAAGRAMETWIDGSRIWFAGPSEQGEIWSELDLAEPMVDLPEWYDLLEERLPLQGEWAAYHPMLLVTWSMNEETDKVDFQCSAGCDRGPQRATLGWLRVLEKDPTLLRLTEDAVIQEHPRFRATISRRTGFLEELTMVSKDGETATIRLVALELDAALDASAFLPPERPASAQDLSAQMTQAFLALELSDARRTTFRRVDGMLDRGEIEWTTRTQDGLEDVLRAVHEPQIRSLAESYGARVRSKIAEFFAELRERLANGESQSALEPEIAQWRADLVNSLDEGPPALQGKLAPAPEQPGRSEHWDDVLSLESRVLEELYGELLKSPLLNEFDGSADGFRRG